MKTWKLQLLAGLFIFGGGFLSAFFYSKARAHFKNELVDNTVFEHRQGQYKLINPLLECDAHGESISDPLGVSRSEVDSMIKAYLKAQTASHIALYFRDLNNGPWIGINIAEEFIGASLMKVPLMIAYLKEAEVNSEILKQKIRFDNIDPNIPQAQFFESPNKLIPGNEYTARELIEVLIKYSDNNALDLLRRNIEPEKVLDVFLALGIGLPDFNKPYPVTVRTYGAFFRVLFNASYLTKDMSELALKLLAQSAFNQGIRAPLPKDLTVAHKFGIMVSEKTGEKQLHDCGIIYYPEHPYLLCVMTRGNNFYKLSEIISDISRLIHNRISQG